ncbi:hypothetical protein SRHO_G00246730 [Serrasalmus rhombeus]
MPVSTANIIQRKDLAKWPYLDGISIPHIQADVELLIGTNASKLLEPWEVMNSHGEGPYAVRTLLGWVLNGSLGEGHSKPPDVDCPALNVNRISVETLEQMLKTQYEHDFNERASEEKEEMSREDLKFMNIMKESVKLEAGHYSLKLPFKMDGVVMPNNLCVAKQRISGLKRKFERHEMFHQEYTKYLNELIQNGYAEQVPQDQLERSDGKLWYIPHHGVFHPRKGTLRVVFDCGAEYRNTSLNKQLLQGPNLTSSLLGVLLRFRQEPVAFMTDVKSMFHQVRVAEDETDFLRFLWWPDGNITQGIVEYRMTVHLFGAVSSPSCACYALRKTAEDNKHMFPTEVIDSVHNNFYVDDFLKSLPSQAEAIQMVKDLAALCHKVTLPAKLMLQELCRKNYGWDDQIPQSLKQQWIKWLTDLQQVNAFKVDRCIKAQDFGQPDHAQLHHFSDASENGYGTVTYLRLQNQNNIHVSFLLGKSRVAPLNQITIPRLELTAAVLAVRIDKMLRTELQLPLDNSCFWTDSTSVLKYIKNEEKRFRTFVANRVSAIREVTDVSQWRYIHTSQNPADDASRGLKVEKLITNKRWLKGPDFLWTTKEEWPEVNLDCNLVPQDPELKKEHRTNAVIMETNATSQLIEYFSDWKRLKIAVAWMLKLKHVLMELSKKRKELLELSDQSCDIQQKMQKVKAALRPQSLSIEDLSEAEKAVIRFSQFERFNNEIVGLSSGKTEVTKGSTIHRLNPVLENELLRVGGRLCKAAMPEEIKHPIILSKDQHISKLILKHIHEQVGHGGRNQVLSKLREKYWITHANAATRKILSSCGLCRRFKGKLGEQKMADLPLERLIPDLPPFTNVGVDYFGPFEVKRGRSFVKRYGVIFTCMASRAIHLEVAYSLDTDACINAIRRFICRRGQVSHLRSDNGTNFTGAERELKEALAALNHDKIQKVFLQEGIKWSFNAPTASHHGGAWERIIRMVRKILISLLHQQTLDDEGLHTVLCEVEAIINDRPITKLSEDPNDLEPLTPNHLLTMKRKPVLPPGLFDRTDMYGKRRWRQVQYISDLFWKRWITEYLPLLQERQKWTKKKRNLVPGDIVLVADTTAPRNSWVLGRVLKTFPDKKGLRVVFGGSSEAETQSEVKELLNVLR